MSQAPVAAATADLVAVGVVDMLRVVMVVVRVHRCVVMAVPYCCVVVVVVVVLLW